MAITSQRPSVFAVLNIGSHARVSLPSFLLDAVTVTSGFALSNTNRPRP
jgi:hypothetical protein